MCAWNGVVDPVRSFLFRMAETFLRERGREREGEKEKEREERERKNAQWIPHICASLNTGLYLVVCAHETGERLLVGARVLLRLVLALRLGLGFIVQLHILARGDEGGPSSCLLLWSNLS